MTRAAQRLHDPPVAEPRTERRAQRVAVIVPAYNEAAAIEATIRSVPAWVEHVLVVDDASRDGTGDIAARLGAPRVEVLRHDRNRGVGAAIRTGYLRALELQVDVAAVMAGDGQMDPSDLPALLDAIADGAHYAKGNRFRDPEVWREMPWTRLAGNVVLSLVTRVTSGYGHVFDSQCGYTAASREALQVVAASDLFPRYGYPNDLLARLHSAGLRVVDVPVRAVYGPGWRSGISLWTVLYPVSFVLLRSWLRRLRRAGRRPVDSPSEKWPGTRR